MGQGYLHAYSGEFLASNCAISYGYIFLVLISGEKRGQKGYGLFCSNHIWCVVLGMQLGFKNTIEVQNRLSFLERSLLLSFSPVPEFVNTSTVVCTKQISIWINIFYAFLSGDVKSFLFLHDFEHLGSWKIMIIIWSELLQISKNKQMRTSDTCCIKGNLEI